MIEVIILAMLGSALLASALTDLWFREVPDWISLALIVSSVALRILWSISDLSYAPFLSGIVGFAIGAALGLTLYYSGQWGGGDAKLLMGIGASLGLDLFGIAESSLVSFFLYLLAASCVYACAWFIGLALANRKKVVTKMLELQQVTWILWWRRLLWVCALAALIAVFVPTIPVQTKGFLLASAAVFLVGTQLSILSKAVERTVLISKMSPELLTEGDWIAEDVWSGDKKICGPKDTGVTLDTIATLKDLYNRRKIPYVVVKEGIPFVPAFFLAFLATVLLPAPFLLLLIF